jgi:hypothetical protein
MELEDSLYPLLREVSIGINPYEVFEDVEWALLIGAKPRGPGMERAGLLDINGQIFAEQVRSSYSHLVIFFFFLSLLLFFVFYSLCFKHDRERLSMLLRLVMSR